MQLSTPRLTLRPLDDSDVDDLWPYVSDPELPRMMTWAAHRSRDETATFVAQAKANLAAGTDIVWAIREQAALIGTVGLHGITYRFRAWETRHGELGYWLGAPHRGRGLAGEAARAVIDFAFDTLGFRKVTVSCLDGNHASQRVIDKLGFRFVGLHRDHMCRDGVWWHLRGYEMTIAERRP